MTHTHRFPHADATSLDALYDFLHICLTELQKYQHQQNLEALQEALQWSITTLSHVQHILAQHLRQPSDT